MITTNLKKRLYTSLALLFAVFLIFNLNLILVFCLIILGVTSILEFLQITKKIFNSYFKLIPINSIFIIYIFVFCFMFFLFSNIIGLKTILFILLIGCIASDLGGFIFGKTIKGPKLTKISPNKTYSGAIGSIILTIFVMSILFYYSSGSFNLKTILIAISTSVSCQFGDLLFSFLKRKAKLKDTGNFFPGHGGVLDRLDGIIIGIPIAFCILIILN